MKETIFILDDNPVIIEIYRKLLRDYKLHCFTSMPEALEFIESSDFKHVALAILDFEIGYGFKVTGLNLAYKIRKYYPDTKIAICTAFNYHPTLAKYIDVFQLKTFPKPIGNEIVQYIELLLKDKKQVTEDKLEQNIRAFMSSAIYFRYIFPIEYELTEDLEKQAESFETLENEINDGFNRISDLLEEYGMDFGHFLVIAGNDIELAVDFRELLLKYIPKILSFIKAVLYSQINFTEEEMHTLEDMEKIGKDIFNTLDEVKKSKV
mgnify:CR=1 FL=1